MLIPVVIPSRARYRFLHNHIDRVLAAALSDRDDVVVARAAMSLRESGTTPPDRTTSSPGH